MKNKKGFTLIELLAVIIILGILMIIAIPAVTEYISSSRKNAYITTASRYIDGVRNKINAAEIPVYDKEATYYIPGSCVSMEKGGKSPYGDWKEYYVVVTYDGTGYDYYWTSRDETNTGIYLTYQDLLDVDRIENNVTSISTNIGVGDREKILLLKDSCSINDAEELIATSSIPEKGTSDGVIEDSETGNNEFEDNDSNVIIATDTSCFNFDSSKGTIVGYYCRNRMGINYIIYVDKCVSYFSDMGAPEDEARLYCTGDSSFEFSLKEDLLSGSLSLEYINQMEDNNVIKIEEKIIKDVVIPEKIDGVTVTRIGSRAFLGSNLYTIEIPETVEYIESSAFSRNNLLYNIVNKTGRSFNWNTIFENGSSDYDNNFIVGDYKAYNRYDVLEFLIKITTVPMSKIDFDKMILVEDMDFVSKSVTLNNSMGYDIYYNNLYSSDDWQKFIDGSKVEGTPVLLKILKDDNILFIGAVNKMYVE